MPYTPATLGSYGDDKSCPYRAAIKAFYMQRFVREGGERREGLNFVVNTLSFRALRRNEIYSAVDNDLLCHSTGAILYQVSCTRFLVSSCR